MPNIAIYKREIYRIFAQILKSPSSFFDAFLGTIYYDLFLAKQCKNIKGKIKRSNKIAIFLIFPKPYVNIGHILSLKYLISEGYSPLVVCNGKISKPDIEILSEFTSDILIRPNYGYDFGGYRDGIRSIRHSKHEVTHLALFNDSCWFPLPQSDSWLTKAEKLEVDFAGALAHAGPDWYEAKMNPNIDRKVKEKQDKLYHYCSFALLFSKNALMRNDFWKFWDNIRISSSKDRTVKYGERSLSKYMFEHQYTHSITLSDDSIAKSIDANAREPSADIFEFLKHGGWPAYALPEHLWWTFRYMFLKKNFKGISMENRIVELKPFVSRLAEPAMGDVTSTTYESIGDLPDHSR